MAGCHALVAMLCMLVDLPVEVLCVRDEESRSGAQGKNESSAPGNGPTALVSWVFLDVGRSRSFYKTMDTRLLRLVGKTLTLYEKATDKTVLASELPGAMAVITMDSQVMVELDGNSLVMTVPGENWITGEQDSGQVEDEAACFNDPLECTSMTIKIQAKKRRSQSCRPRELCAPLDQIFMELNAASVSSETEVFPQKKLRIMPPSATMALSKAPYKTPHHFYQITVAGDASEFTDGSPEPKPLTQLFQDSATLNKGSTYLWLITLSGSFRWAVEHQDIQLRSVICHGDLNSVGFVAGTRTLSITRGMARAGGELNFRDVYDSTGQITGQAWVIDDRTSFQGNRIHGFGKASVFGSKMKSLLSSDAGVSEGFDPDMLSKAVDYLRTVLNVDLAGVYARSDITKKQYLEDTYPDNFKQMLPQETPEVLAVAPYVDLSPAP